MRHSIIAVLSLLCAFWVFQVCARDLVKPLYHPALEAAAGKSTRSVAIRGLLETRQRSCVNSNYGVCRNTGSCCPIGGDCCSDGRCCNPGQRCIGHGRCCDNNEFVCETIHCCPNGWNCCRDGGCCNPGSYCVIGTNGVIGCCPNGETCYGPVGGPGAPAPTHNTQPPPPMTTHQAPPPPPPTTTPDSTSSDNSSFTSPTDTFTLPNTSPVTSPSPTPNSGTNIPKTPGFTSVVVGPTDDRITWTTGWILGSSTCSASSKKTTTRNQSFTYMTKPDANPLIYISIASNDVVFDIFINGAKNSVDTTVFQNCTYILLDPLPMGTSSNVTVLVYGVPMSGRQLSSGDGPNWSFTFNSFIIEERSSSAGPTMVGNSAPRSTTAAAAVSVGLAMTLLSVALLL
ncbi:hypothetical protein AX17_006066 [Amanita inopinata Kibby_2008]|nr:hypothetical protein AX17_006066 [Amanita inopinata Kibby_2008]